MEGAVSSGAGNIPAAGAIAASLRSFSNQASDLSRSWFTELVAAYLRWRSGRRAHAPSTATPEAERAEAIIRQACVKTAVTGATAGALATSAALVTEDTGGVGGAFAIPAGLLSIGAEMVLRALLHLDMTCDLAEVFGVPFDPEDPEDLWRLYALAFHTETRSEAAENQDQDILHRIIDPEDRAVGGEIGNKLLRESLLRNVVPFLGVATSSVANWRLTRQIGDTVRRYCRYQRALQDTMKRHHQLRDRYLDLVIEGMWFIYTADGHLSPEEAATLARLLRMSTPHRRKLLENRLVADESAWLQRIAAVPKADRGAFLELLEVAAAMDKAYSEPEQRLIAQAAQVLRLEPDPEHVSELMQQFQNVGVLSLES